MKRTLNSTVLSLVLLVVTAVCITASGILYKQPLLHILPLYISLVISLLQARVNRVAYLIGAGNAILYAIVYWHFRLYASAVYAILFSFTIQLATYFLWSRRPSGNATIFRALKPRQRIGMVLVFIAVWAALYAILSASGSAYRFFDISYSSGVDSDDACVHRIRSLNDPIATYQHRLISCDDARQSGADHLFNLYALFHDVSVDGSEKSYCFIQKTKNI